MSKLSGSSFIIELVSNASTDIYPDNTLSSFTNFLPEQVTLDDETQWEVAVMEISYPARYNNITDGHVRYVHNFSTGSPVREIRIPKGLYPSVSHVATAIKDEITKFHSDASGMLMAVDELDGKMVFRWPSKDSRLNFASNDVANIMGFSGPCVLPPNKHHSDLPADIQRIHTIMIYTDIIEHGIIGNVKAPILRCFPFIPRIRNGDIELTHYMNYKAFEKLQFRRVLKNSFHSIKIDLRDSTGEKIPFAGVGITRLTLMFRRVQ